MFHLGSTPATVKLKGIDGGPHKRRNMWFNSMIREEPYPGSNAYWIIRRRVRVAIHDMRGAAWLSSARAVRCRLKCHNERNPHLRLPPRRGGHSGETAGASCEEGGDDVKSARPLRPGRHTCYNGGEQREATWRQGADPENPSQFGLESATRLHEAGFASNRASAMAR